MLRRKILYLILILLGIAGFAACAVMMVMAVRFHEWGRVLAYGIALLLCAELVILSFLRLRNQCR